MYRCDWDDWDEVYRAWKTVSWGAGMVIDSLWPGNLLSWASLATKSIVRSRGLVFKNLILSVLNVITACTNYNLFYNPPMSHQQHVLRMVVGPEETTKWRSHLFKVNDYFGQPLYHATCHLSGVTAKSWSPQIGRGYIAEPFCFFFPDHHHLFLVVRRLPP